MHGNNKNLIKSITLVIVDGIKESNKTIPIIKNNYNILKNIPNIIINKPILFTPDELCKNEYFDIISIDKLSYIEYNKFILKDLNKYIKSNFVLICQSDGYIINPECWNDNFLNFDYIGAPWPNLEFKNRVGNGGFSLRSKKFLDICEILFEKYPDVPIRYNHPDYLHEDFLACNVYYEEMIKAGIKFSDIETASNFSIEHPILEKKNKTFGFHGNFKK